VTEQLTARELRPILRQAELDVAHIGPSSSPEQILSLYHLLDQIGTALPNLQQAGAQLEPESVRFETIGAILRDKARSVVKGLKSGSGWAAYREQVNPPESHWWWYLDQQFKREQARRRARRMRIALWASAVVAVLITLYVAFLRPDRTTRQLYDYELTGESQLQQGNYAQALASYQKALKLAPEDAESLLATGVLYEALDQPDRAKAQYAKAEAKYDTRASFLTARAQQYIYLGWYEQAGEQAQAAIELDDRYALAYCTLGSAYQELEAQQEAIEAFWTCSDLAMEQGQDTLYVRARMILSNLLQQPSGLTRP
jgi:tetratricopeptide (TPR) repeat protein